MTSKLDEKTLDHQDVIEILNLSSENDMNIEKHDSMLSHFRHAISSAPMYIHDPQPLANLHYS